MSTIETKKRKREDEPPRVTFTTPRRTFERLLKETSLDALRTAVAKKLGTDAKTPIEFAQVRDGRHIDLEDEDDFDAFKSYASFNGVAEVQVKLSTESSDFTRQRQTSDGTGKSRTDPAQLTTNGPSTSEAVNENSNHQTNGISGLQDSPSVSLKPPQKKTQQRARKPRTQAPPSVPAAETPAEGVPEVQEDSARKHRSSSAKNDAPFNTEPKENSDPAARHIEPSRDKDDSTSATVPVRKVGAAKPGKDKTEKKPKGKAGQSGAADIKTLVDQPNGAIAYSPPLPASTVPEPAPEAPAPEPPQQPKKRKGKKQQASEPVNAVNGGRDQSPVESSTTLPASKDVPQEGQPTVGHVDTSSTSQDKFQSKKRKRGTDVKSKSKDADGLEPGKSKKRKANDHLSTTKSQTVEPETTASRPPDAASTDAKSKPKTSKGKKKPATAEEMAQYDETLDSVIANVLAKRVRASSKHTTATASVPTIVSTAPTVKLGAGPIERSTVTDADDIALEKKKKGKKKSSEVIAPEPAPHIDDPQPISSDILAEAPENAPADCEQADRQPGSIMGTLHETSQRAQSASTVAKGSLNVEETTGTKRSLRSTAANKGQRDASTASNSQPGSSTNRPTRMKPAIDDQDVVDKVALLPKSKDAEQPSISEAPPFAPPGSNISVVTVEGKDEGSSSSPSSDSGSSDSDSDDSSETPILPSVDKESLSIVNGTAYPAPNSSFAIGDGEVVDSMDLDSLLHPGTNKVSWQKVAQSVENDGDEKVDRMSDVEEEEEDERSKKAPRSSLATKRAQSSSGEEDDDDDDNFGSGAVAFEEDAIMSKSEVVSSLATPEETDGPFLSKGTISTEKKNEALGQRATLARSDVEMAEPDSDNPRPGSTQSQQSPPLPSLKDINTRAESVLTEHVADSIVNRVMEEDGTVFLTNVGKTGQERPVAHTSMADTRSPEVTLATLPNSRTRKTNDMGKDEPALRKNEPKTPAVLPSRTKRATSEAPADAFVSASTRSSLSQERALSQDSGARGMVKRMKGRDGKQFQSNAPLSQPLATLHEDPGPMQSTPVNDRRRRDNSQRSQHMPAKEPAISQSVGSRESETARQRKMAAPPVPSDEITQKTGSVDAEAGAAVPPSSQVAYTHLSQPRRKERKPPAAVSTPKRGGPNNASAGFNSASTTEVERSINGETQSTRVISPETSIKGKGKSTLPTPPFPASSTSGESEAEESESESESGDRHSLVQQSRIHSTRPSIPGMRSLTDIANNRELFSSTSTPRNPYALSLAFGSQIAPELGHGGGDDEDSDDSSSSSNSDEDSDVSLTIPRDRRAGSIPAKANKSHTLVFPFT